MSLSALTPDKLAEICKGYWLNDKVPDFALHRAVIDSREITANSLFIALRGAQTDGHAFLDSLAGAKQHAAMVKVPNGEIDLPQLCVSNVEKGFQALAEYIAHHTHAHKIAITGSVGKTGTKDMIAEMLQKAGKVHATKGNLNNHLGVPLTLSDMAVDTDFLVTEMGMNSAGEINLLSNMVRPDIAIITRISNTHVGFFNNLSEIAEAKAEIFLGTDAFGVAILPRDDEFYGQLAGSARLCGLKNIISFGRDEDSTVCLERLSAGENSLEIEASLPHPSSQGRRQHVEFTLGMQAEHYAMNALCALATAYALKLDLDALLPAFATMQESDGRGRKHQLAHAGSNICLIDDSYNASPASIKAALNAVASHDARHLLIIFSDMLELGEAGLDEHLRLTPAIEAAGAKSVLAIGPFMQACCSELPATIHTSCFTDADSLLASLEENLAKLIGTPDVILVKGSHGSGAYKVSQYLINRLSQKHNGPSTPEGGVFHAA